MIIDNRYQVIKKLGTGGLGEVYRVYDKIKNKEMALKLFPSSKSVENLLHIKKEFLTMTKLKHPNIIEVYDFGLTSQKIPYFTMEYINGKDICKLFNSGGTLHHASAQYQLLYSLIVQICQALEFIHFQGLIHCDIKPGNILVVGKKSPRVYLMDFGLVEKVDISHKKEMQGTIEYMAPEMIKGLPIDRRTDLYSLGVLLYETVTGKLPFTGETPISILKQHLEKTPTPPVKYVKNIPQELNKIILKLLSKHPETRYQRARDVIYDITKITKEKITLISYKEKLLNSSFVGREKELSQLINLLTDKGGNVISITGEFGIGKSRLIEEFRIHAQLEGWNFWKGTCYEEKREPYAPIIEILNNIIIKYKELIKDYKEFLAQIIPQLGGKKIIGGEKISLFDGITQFLIEVSKREPYVLFLENTEWLDQETIEFLNYFVRNIKNTKIILCFESCKERINTLKIENNIHLEGLTEDEINTMITSMLGGDKLSSSHIKRIFTETRGNPLFVQELLKSMVDKVLIFKENKWIIEEIDFEKLRISKTVQQIFEKRLEELSKDTKPGIPTNEILKIMSIFPQKIDLQVIQGMPHHAPTEDELLLVLNKLLEKKILIERSDGYYFANSQLREIVYKKINSKTRKKFHQTIAEMIENKSEDVEELAYHYARGEDKKKAFSFLVKAGEKARSVYAYKSAIKYFEQAIKLQGTGYPIFLHKKLGDTYRLMEEYSKAINKYKEILQYNPSDSELFDIYCALGISFYKKGEYDSALKIYNQCRATISDEALKARLNQEMSWVYQAKGEYELALSTANKGLQIAKKYNNLQEEGRIEHNLGTIYLRKGELNKALECFTNSLKIKEKIGDLQGIAVSHNNLGVVYFNKGNIDTAFLHYEKGLKIFQKIKNLSGVASGYKNLGTICYRQEDLEKAKEYYNKALEIQQRIGDKAGISTSYNNIALVYNKQQKWDTAIDYFTRSVEIKKEIKDLRGIAGCYNNLGLVYSSKEDWNKALEYYKKSLEIKEKLGDSPGVANSLINLGAIYINQGQNESALLYLERAKKIGKKIGSNRILIETFQVLGELYLNKKEIKEAFNSYSDALKLAVKLNDKVKEGIILRNLSKVFKFKKDNKKTEEYLLQSIEVLKKTKAEIELARSYLEIGKWKREIGDLKNKLLYLKEAKKIFEKNGLEKELKEVKDILRARISKDLIGVYHISSIINSILDLRELLNKIMDVAIETLEAERGLLILKDKETNELKIEVARGLEKRNIEDTTLISDSIIRDVVFKQRSLLTADAGTDKRFRDRKSVINYHITSVLCVPLKIKKETIGAIYLDHRNVSELFDSSDLSFLTAFANFAAIAIENVRLHEKLKEENLYLKQEVKERYKFGNIIGKSTQMKKVYQLMEKVIETSTNVLIEGETGTGKEIVARTIHFNSPRRDKKFVAVDCAAIPVSLFESEFFGHKKGAFTGAIRDKKGLFVSADGGTLFLDEITNMSLEAQAKLLRVIQEGEIRPLGEEKYRKIDVRIIAATNKELKKEVEKGNFRADLYYRLNVITIKLPPLRERKEDIILLANYFLDKYSKELKKKCKGFTSSAMRLLLDYEWPGNVRELEHQVERAVTLSSRELITEELFSIGEKEVSGFQIKEVPLKDSIEALEQEIITRALRKYKYKKDAAKALGLSRFGLDKKIERYNIKYSKNK